MQRGFYFLFSVLGQKRFAEYTQDAGVSVTMTLLVSALFAAAAVIFPRFIIGIYSKDPAVIEEGARYITVAALSYIPYAISSVLYSVFRSMNKTRIPLFVSALALGVNTFLNYAFHTRNFGMPALGVRGAAIATVTARGT